MLKFKKDGYARHDSGTVYKVKDISLTNITRKYCL